jgi:hypothetical protein
MERQRSFSFKPTRLLLFTFTIFSSIFFLSTFTIWLTKSTTTPSLHHQQSLLHFNTSTNNNNNKSVAAINLQPLTVHSLTQNFTVTKIQTLIDNRLSRSQKSFSESKSEDIEQEHEHHVDDDVSTSSVNFTAMYGNGTKVEENGLVGKSDKVLIFKEIEVKKKIVKECDLRKGY